VSQTRVRNVRDFIRNIWKKSPPALKICGIFRGGMCFNNLTKCPRHKVDKCLNKVSRRIWSPRSERQRRLSPDMQIKEFITQPDEEGDYIHWFASGFSSSPSPMRPSVRLWIIKRVKLAFSHLFERWHGAIRRLFILGLGFISGVWGCLGL